MADPWMKFYTSDWRADPRLKMCSAGARGVWIEMICLMHEATPYGHLLVYGQPPNEAQLASLTGIPSAELNQYLAELERMGVFSRTKESVIYSRKLVRMDAKSAKARKNGKKGGNPSLGKKTEKQESLNYSLNGDDKPQKPEARSQRVSVANATATGAQPQPPDGQVSDDQLLDEIMAAVGLTSGRTPTHWMPPASTLHVSRWRSQLGLTPKQIIDAARESRKRHDDPPNGPKALDGAMQRLASALSADPLKVNSQQGPSIDQKRERWRKIAGGSN